MQLPKSIPQTGISEKKLKQSPPRERAASFARRALLGTIFLTAILVAVAYSEASDANEGAAAAEPAKAEGGAEAAGGEKSTGGKPACRYSDHESFLLSYMAKIRGLEKEISDMIETKHHVENADRVKLLTQQITFKHMDLAKTVREYEDVRRHMRFQHPDRGLDTERRYKAARLKSLDEIEEAFGLDGRLDRIRKQVGVVFPIDIQALPEAQRGPASVQADEEEDKLLRVHLKK